MKRKIVFALFLLPTVVLAQSHSWDGKSISPNAKIRCLNIFVNIIYDIHPDTNVFYNNEYWPMLTDTNSEGINNAAIPTYLLDFMDTVYVPGHLHGTCTRLYGESSFDSLQITGDFMVVNIRESTITSRYSFGETGIRNAVKNLIAQCGFSTIYGHNRIADYDYDHNNEFDYVNMLVRNITRAYGGDNPGSGFNGAPISPIYIDGISYECKEGTFQCVGDGDFYANPTSIVIHEISHSLFGGNNFHTSGGNHRGSTETMAFLNIQGGYGLMGAAGSSLVSCNGYERWRMHWKHPQSSDYISALNSTGLVSVNSDISKEDGNQTFVLRDFVTFGDAVRIKLPYKDSETSSNQYIWLENHQIRDDKLDFLQYSNSADSGCRPRGKAGIYAYYQIGRDILEGNEVWDNYHRDNLKIIPAEGYFDYVMEADTYNLNCISYDEHFYTLTRTTANSFCGGQDQEKMFFPQNTDSVLNLSRERAMWRKKVDGVNEDWLSSIGDTLDAFVPPAKINMGTNPSSCNAKTLHSRNHELNAGRIDSAATHKNTQTTYLTGLSIEMLWVSRSSIKVNIRWDDYDIVNDTRWTGKIALKDTAILTTPYTITLAQNKTVALPYRDAETGLFSGRTQWRCESNSYFRQEDSTHVYLTENSSLAFQDGSTYEQAQNATMHVQAGCTLHIQSGANAILKGTLKIDSGALVIVNGIAHFDTSARLIVNPGGKLLVEGGKLTSMGTNAMWRGVEVLGNRTKHQVAQFQGTVELKDGAVIENAVTAIRTGERDNDWLTTGGIIIARDAIFRNNQRAIEFLSYYDTLSDNTISDNASCFVKCVFTIDTNNLLALNNRQFYHHVTLWDVKNIKFKGCVFENKMHRGRLCEGKGIYTIDAGFTFSTYPFVYATYSGGGSSIPEPFAFNEFQGFNVAIDAETTGNQYAIKIDEAKFDNNQQAITINGNNYVEIIRCDINQTAYKSLTPYKRKGIALNCCTGYHIEENRFYDNYQSYAINSYGIKVSESGRNSNMIYRNTFNKLENGILVSGINGNSRSGLQFWCNSFSNNNYDINLMGSSVVSPTQGTRLAGADNDFARPSSYDIYNGGSTSLIYLYSASAPIHYPSLTYQVIVSSLGVSSNPCSSSIFELNPFMLDFDKNRLATMVSSYQNMDSERMTQWEMTSDNTYNASSATSEMTSLQQKISDLYYETVFQIMLNSLTDMTLLADWHAAASVFSDPYSLSETINQMNETVVLADVAIEDSAERENYAAFRALKAECSALTVERGVNWYAISEEQIEKLIQIAELNTGRTSVMAKGILCFFFGICYEDDDEVSQTRNARCMENNTNKEMQASELFLYPNPTNYTFSIRFSNTQEKVRQVQVMNLTGKVMLSMENPCENMVNISNLPIGTYVVRIFSQSGKEYATKIVKE